MSAPFEKIGVLAGGGAVPVAVLESCQAQGIDTFVVGFEGFVDPAIADVTVRLGAVGATLQALRDHDVSDVVLIGSLQKPSLMNLRPDMKAMGFLAKYGYEALGDDGLLRALRRFLEDEGFSIHGAHQLVPGLLTPAGVLGTVSADGFEVDIDLGVQAALDWGAQDKGQSVIVVKGAVVAREERAGTDAMIRDTQAAGGVLVKMCKPQQDQDLDLPTIGPETVQNAIEAGLKGIVVHAGASLFVQREEALKLADEAGIFVVGADG